MSKLLQRVRAGRVKAPLRVLVYGVEGVGKTTFAADAPKPLFCCAEQGTLELDVARLTPRSWAEAQALVGELIQEPHEYGSLVIDTVDWLDALAGAELAKSKGKQTAGEIPFGKGWDLLADKWRSFLGQLDALRLRRGMPIVLLGHAKVAQWKNPDGDDYSRWALATSHEKVAAVLRQWADVVCFAGFETSVYREGERGMAKGRGSTRWLFTQRTASYDAKNRYGLPQKVALSWPELVARIETRGHDAKAFRAQLEGEATQLTDPDTKAAALGLLGRAGDDPRKLAQAQNWIHAKLDEQQAQAPEVEEQGAPDEPPLEEDPGEPAGASEAPTAVLAPEGPPALPKPQKAGAP